MVSFSIKNYWYICYSKNRLKGVFQKNPKKLADRGFEVDDTPPAKKSKKTTP